MQNLEGLRRECVRIGTYISDPIRRAANNDLREPLSDLQVRAEALTPEKVAESPELLPQLVGELATLNSQVRSS